jgi:hypothetical protein
MLHLINERTNGEVAENLNLVLKGNGNKRREMRLNGHSCDRINKREICADNQNKSLANFEEYFPRQCCIEWHSLSVISRFVAKMYQDGHKRRQRKTERRRIMDCVRAPPNLAMDWPREGSQFWGKMEGRKEWTVWLCRGMVHPSALAPFPHHHFAGGRYSSVLVVGLSALLSPLQSSSSASQTVLLVNGPFLPSIQCPPTPPLPAPPAEAVVVVPGHSIPRTQFWRPCQFWARRECGGGAQKARNK